MWIPEPKQYWFEEQLETSVSHGSAHYVSAETTDDVVRQLREVVEEITGKPFPVRKMGFY